jgi:peptide deformylase
MALELIPDTDPILRTATTAVELEDIPSYKDIVTEMFEVMRANHGVGLAAPQVGISKSFFIMFNGSANIVCFNPEIIDESDDAESLEEGCLSFKDKKLWINRRKWIKASYYDLNGKLKTPKFTGVMARAFQHEYDHTQGIVFTDRG